MTMFRFTTAGESHGRALIAIVEGLPAGLPIDIDQINRELWRRAGKLFAIPSGDSSGHAADPAQAFARDRASGPGATIYFLRRAESAPGRCGPRVLFGYVRKKVTGLPRAQKQRDEEGREHRARHATVQRHTGPRPFFHVE